MPSSPEGFHPWGLLQSPKMRLRLPDVRATWIPKPQRVPAGVHAGEEGVDGHPLQGPGRPPVQAQRNTVGRDDVENLVLEPSRRSRNVRIGVRRWTSKVSQLMFQLSQIRRCGSGRLWPRCGQCSAFAFNDVEDGPRGERVAREHIHQICRRHDHGVKCPHQWGRHPRPPEMLLRAAITILQDVLHLFAAA